MKHPLKSWFAPIAFVVILVAAASEAWGAAVLPTISITEGDTGLPDVSITGFPTSIVFNRVILPESVMLSSSSVSTSPDFGPTGFVLTDAGGVLSDVLVVVVTDGILTVQFDSDSATGTLTAPPGFPSFSESSTPQTLVVSPGTYPTFQLSILSDLDATTVPEPATLILVGAGILASAGVRLRRRRHA